MKRFKPTILLVALIVCMCLAFSSCIIPDLVVNGNNSGSQNGESTVSEAMLMYREALAEGYEGSYLQFLEEYFHYSEGSGDGQNTNILISDNDSNAGADLAALSVVKIESTFTYRSGGSFGPQIPRTATAQGAGVVYYLNKTGGDAYIITNYHVIYEANSVGTETVAHVSDNINVWLFGGETESEKLSATFVGGVIDYDVAVLFINGGETVTESDGTVHSNASVIQNSAVRPITVGDSDELTIGDKVFAIGNPNGEGIAATQGIVSVDAEYIEMSAINNSTRNVESLEIRIDAAVNHGNSGGGLFNSRGEYIGTVNARSEEDGVTNFGYAIPSNLTIAIAHNVIDSLSYGALKANLGITTEVLSSHSVYDEETGRVGIVETVAVSSATLLGASWGSLKSGDVLLSVTLGGEKREITREHQLVFLSFNLREGDIATFEVLRNGEVVTVDINFNSSHFQAIY